MLADEIPDEALVVRGGQNLPENFAQGSGVQVGMGDKLDGVSVNASANLSVQDLAAPDFQTGYPGILNNQLGVTTVGEIRRLGGVVTASPTRSNPNHATLSGITPQQASELFRPTISNPHRRKKA
jgi:hypothetical protein